MCPPPGSKLVPKQRIAATKRRIFHKRGQIARVNPVVRQNIIPFRKLKFQELLNRQHKYGRAANNNLYGVGGVGTGHADH